MALNKKEAVNSPDRKFKGPAHRSPPALSRNRAITNTLGHRNGSSIKEAVVRPQNETVYTFKSFAHKPRSLTNPWHGLHQIRINIPLKFFWANNKMVLLMFYFSINSCLRDNKNGRTQIYMGMYFSSFVLFWNHNHSACLYSSYGVFFYYIFKVRILILYQFYIFSTIKCCLGISD